MEILSPAMTLSEESACVTADASANDSLLRFTGEMRAYRASVEPCLLDSIPVIGVTHYYNDEDEPDRDASSSELVTLFLGPNAQAQRDKFQSDLQEHWLWDEPFVHKALTEQPWDSLLEKGFMLFIMAEGFHPSIRQVLQRANLFNVAAVVITHEPATFPKDIFPILHIAQGQEFTGALRAIIGGVVNPNLFCIDLGDIWACMRHSRRLIQTMGEAPDAKQLPLAVERAVKSLNALDANVAGAKYLLGWITTGPDVDLDDYYAVSSEIAGWVNEECEVIVAVNHDLSVDGMARVVLTWAGNE